ncbi:DUF3631 domain-containing protein [Jiangella muralis]|uniref:DUF3631 domain-containing protein n=1 Tax=Jiangella muralis TaxID=702383 RepID=UPI0009F9E28B|nr:DUF3631 domain-containing protein [Jiangella muralis]
MIDYGTDYGDPLAEGAELLDDVRTAITRYCILPTPETVDATVLWVATTHCLPAFEYAPRLVIRSAEKRSGKSRLLEVVDVLAHSPLRVVNASVSYIFRSLGGEHPPTLLIDEADTIFGTKVKAEQNEDLRGLLNAGFQRGLNYGRTVGPSHIPTEFEVFAMAALAGIGRMPDTIEDRAVVVQMRRRKPSERVSPYRRRRDSPALVELSERLALWAQGAIGALSTAEPDLPVEDRAADTWEPLIAVADAIGGDWPARARRAAEALTAEAEEHDSEASLNVRLLGDIRDIFTAMTVSFLPSKELCNRLQQVEDAPWRDFEMNPSKLGRRLAEYDIRTGHNTAKTARGYCLPDFLDAFERYLPADKASQDVHAVQLDADQQERPDTLDGPDTMKASGDSKVSGHNTRSDPIGTGSDTFGRLPAQDGAEGRPNLQLVVPACPECGHPVDSDDHGRACEGEP